MFIKKTKIEGLIILKTKIFKDSRGSLKEVYQRKILKTLVINLLILEMQLVDR